MKIQKLTSENVVAVVGLWCENWEEAGDSVPTPADRARIHNVIEGYVSNPQVCCFVAEQEGEVVGFITGAVTAHPVMEGLLGTLEELYVRPAYRRQSVGSQLVRAAEAFLRQRGAGVLKTHTCAESDIAKAFWAAVGWEADTTTFSLYALA